MIDIAVLGVVILFAACLQGSIGMGLGMVAAPIIALVNPNLLPATVLILATLVSAFAWFRERSRVQWRVFSYAFIGRAPGIVIGAVALVMLPTSMVGILLSMVVFCGVVFSVLGWSPPPHSRNVVVAGLFSGFFGTATSIGGPPMSLVMREFEPNQVRSTLSAFFTIGTLASLAALWFTGSFGLYEFYSTLIFVPFMLAGLFMSNFVVSRLDKTRLISVGTFAAVVGSLLLLIESLITFTL